MSVLLDRTTRVIIQGFTGSTGTFHAQEMIAYGTNLVGGVTPGKGGTRHLDRPVFNTVKDAVAHAGATASLVLVPPPFAADSILEAADAGLTLCVAITDGIPAQDIIQVKRTMRRYAFERRMRLVGPNCAGVISPDKAMMGIMPGHIYQQGRVGIVGRSGTLGYEAAAQMAALGIGITTSVGIGGIRSTAARSRTSSSCSKRTPGGRGRAIHPGSHEEAGGRLCRGPERAQGPQDGPRRGDHLGVRRERGGQGRDPEGRGRHCRPEPGRARRPGRVGARAPMTRIVVA